MFTLPLAEISAAWIEGFLSRDRRAVRPSPLIGPSSGRFLVLEAFIMRTSGILLTRVQPPLRSISTARLPDFIALMKPRVMALAVFTAFVGLVIAPRHVDPIASVLAVLAIAAG